MEEASKILFEFAETLYLIKESHNLAKLLVELVAEKSTPLIECFSYSSQQCPIVE
ncbi:protein of unknown function [Nitrospira japonica]|uniref:Uncharacterized protein n=1 Tax=Nitrospira japonica TaxID=1325564 RepID=A0A1W1I4X9_9BACT|nr:protein of unknown function [Nitrospira japonica]